jgi:hypothetical protein
LCYFYLSRTNGSRATFLGESHRQRREEAGDRGKNSPVATLEVGKHVIFSLKFQVTRLRNVMTRVPGHSGASVK